MLYFEGGLLNSVYTLGITAMYNANISQVP